MNLTCALYDVHPTFSIHKESDLFIAIAVFRREMMYLNLFPNVSEFNRTQICCVNWRRFVLPPGFFLFTLHIFHLGVSVFLF